MTRTPRIPAIMLLASLFSCGGSGGGSSGGSEIDSRPAITCADVAPGFESCGGTVTRVSAETCSPAPVAERTAPAACAR